MQKKSRFLTEVLFPLGVLLAGLAIAFFPLFFLGKTLFFADNFSLFVPQRLFLVQQLGRGELPFWNPYILNGLPYFANISKTVLYPPTYLFALFSPGVAVNIITVGHLLWSGVGMYYTARLFKFEKWQSALAAFLWMLSVHLVAAMNNLVVIQTLAWIPWVFGLSYAVFHLGQYKKLPFLILATVMNVLGGHTQPLIYSGVLATTVAAYGVWKDWRQNIAPLVIWGVLSFCLSGIILLPLADYAAQTTRMDTTTTEALSGSMHPLHLAKFILPYFWSNPSKGVAWGPDWGIMRENAGYITVTGILVLVVTARRLWRERLMYRFLLLVSAASLVLSFGRHFPVVRWIYENFEFIHFLRSPSSVLTLWVLSTAFLVAAGIRYLKPTLRTAWAVMALTILALLSITVVELQFPRLWTTADTLLKHKLSTSVFHTQAKNYAMFQMISENVIVTSLITSAVLFLLSRRQTPKTQWAMVMLLVAEMIYAFQGMMFYAPVSIYVPRSEVAQSLQKYITPQTRFVTSVGLYPWTGLPSYWENINFRPPFQETRFSTEEQQTFAELQLRRDLLTTNWGMPYFLPTSYGYSTFIMKRTAEEFSLDLPGSNINELDAKNFHVPQLSEFGNRYLIIDKTIHSPEFWQEEMKSFTLLEDHPKWAVYENPAAKAIIRPLMPVAEAEIFDLQRTANTLQFTARLPQSAQIFIAETYEKGWQAWANGQKLPITEYRSGRLIELPAGQTTVTMKYRPVLFQPGAFLSLAGLFGLGMLVIWLANGRNLISTIKLPTISGKHVKK